MTVWAFTTEAYPEHRRFQAWAEALNSLSLLLKRMDEEIDLHGLACSATSPLGIVFARISSGPAELALRPDDKNGALWLALSLDGVGTLRKGASEFVVRPGDIFYGPFDPAVALVFASPFRMLFIRMPRVAIGTRLLAPSSLEVGYVPSQRGIGKVLGGMLAAVAGSIEQLSAEDLRPIELAVAEFMVTLLLNQISDERLSGGTSTQDAILHRICQQIESRLHEPDLTFADIATAEGLSTRYLQKLFTAAGESFSSYLKQRRLERSRSDLVNPLYSHLSITDICFRWGFNDGAHFSRAFRARFGISPRGYRQENSDRSAESLLLQASRGRPHDPPAPGRKPLPGDGDERRGTTNAAGPLVPSVRGTSAVEDAFPPSSVAAARHHYLPVSDKTVHWGYFSRSLAPVLEIQSGDVVTIETLTQHGYDDHERMIKGDTGAESVFHWTAEHKSVDRRGAGPMDASIYGRGAGEGFGVHICTGPIAIDGARSGDVIELRILDIRPRPCANPLYAGRSFGSNAASWWGFHYKEFLTEPKPREVVTIYEFEHRGDCCGHAKAVYNYRWTPQTDPFGVVHPTIDYPGVPVDHATIAENHNILRGVSIPVRPHFGVIGVAPKEAELVDSIPPAYFGGNIDNWRTGKGATIYLPVSVAGGLLSIGDPHASQGDSEVCGTAIECSLTGVVQILLHKKQDLAGHIYQDLSYPLVETHEEWVLQGFSHPNYLAEFGQSAQSDVYEKSSLDLAMQDAFRKARRFLMNTKGLSEDEAISLMSVAVDFGVTQVVDGNWGVHAIIRKALFEDERDRG